MPKRRFVNDVLLALSAIVVATGVGAMAWALDVKTLGRGPAVRRIAIAVMTLGLLIFYVDPFHSHACGPTGKGGAIDAFGHTTAFALTALLCAVVAWTCAFLATRATSATEGIARIRFVLACALLAAASAIAAGLAFGNPSCT